METIVKDTVYTAEDMSSMSLEKMHEILDGREISYSHLAKEGSLSEKILESNPELPGSGGGVVGQMEEASSQTVDNTPKVEAVASNDSGIVLLELVDPKRTGSLRVRDYTDNNGNKRKLVDKNGDPWVYMITKQEKLNLATYEGKTLYEHLRDHKYFLGGGGIVPSIRLVHEGQDAVKNVTDIEDGIKAQNIIMQLDEKDLRDFARALKVTVAHNKSAVVVKSLCYDLCQSNPRFVIEMWNDPRRDLRVYLYKAMDKGLIVKVDNVFKYENLPVGITFDECILWFEKNPDFLPGLRNEVNK